MVEFLFEDEPMPEEQQPVNRLIHEKSPYLLQHANNPVDWYPWGQEAFDAARAQDKPIFLSIGYATCHWCHVMEEESFRDREVARVLNETFISVKVDREEHPEVDSLYMEFAQTMIIGSAGWPLNLILTPDLKPFFAATYLPKNNAKGLIGLTELAKKIGQLWQSEDKERLVSQADKLVEIVRARVHISGEEMPFEERIMDTAEILFRIADPIYGGMKGAPKFPLGYQGLFLLRYFIRYQENRALFLAEKTLEMMHRGGIYDHVGGGFSRYSVDEKWMIPHFEKMLYDNALLADAYLEAWRVTGRELYQNVAHEVLEYILRNLSHSEGGFYSAEDADSQGVEGLFYTWTLEEIERVLTPEETELFSEYYGVNEDFNFHDRCVPYIDSSLEEYAEYRGIDIEELDSILSAARQKLFTERQKRVHPLKDDKIITAWNGLAIGALARAGFYFREPDYLSAAVSTARFIRTHLFLDGKLERRYRGGDARFPATLEDYAFLIQGLISLYEAGTGSEWLTWALELTAILERDFKGPEGAFYQTDGKDPHVLIRKCHFADGAEPSGNAVHAENLLRLAEITGKKEYAMQAEDIFRAACRYIDSYPLGYCYQLMALLRYYDTKRATITIALNDKGELREDIIDALVHKVMPHHSIVWRQKAGESEEFTKTFGPFPVTDKTCVTICHEGVCGKPLDSRDQIIDALRKL
jgi:hypothetical protein